ncbi:MAG: NmrA family NAD(P)-binding protein [Polyangiales bacterium]
MSDVIAPVLVTGATGNVGRAVASSLRALGVPCVAAVRDPRAAAGGGTPAVAFDFHDPATYAGALRGARGLFLLRPPAIADVRATLNALVDRAIEAGVEHVAFLSVEGADRQRWVPHHAVERHLGARGVSSTILRPGFFAQNLGDAYRADIRDDDRVFVPAGRGRVAFVDVRDVGEVAARSFAEPQLRRAAYTLTGPRAVTFDEVARALSARLGRAIRYEPASALGYARHLRRRGAPWAQAAVQTALHVGLRFGNAARVDPALGHLLRRPARDLEAFIADHVELWARPPSAPAGGAASPAR